MDINKTLFQFVDLAKMTAQKIPQFAQTAVDPKTFQCS